MFNNFDIVGKDFVNTVVVGISDLSAFMGVKCDNIDGEELFDRVLTFSEKQKPQELKLHLVEEYQ